MKKKFAGRISAAITVSAAMLCFSVYAGAADYGSGAAPTVVKPNASTVTETVENVVAGTEADAPATVLTEEAVETAIKNSGNSEEVTVYMTESSSGAAVVKEDTIGKIASGNTVVTVKIEDKDGKESYSVTIDPADIKEVKSINLSMNIEVKNKNNDLTAGDKALPNGAVVISPAQKGDFGMTLTVTLPAETLRNVEPSNAMLFYISNSGKITRLSDSSITVNPDKTVSISISHASSYVITDVDLLGTNTITEDLDDTDPDDSDDYNEPDDGDSDDGYDDELDPDDSDAVDLSGKNDDEVVVVIDDGSEDINPGTGTAIAAGTAAVIAGIVAAATRKRK